MTTFTNLTSLNTTGNVPLISRPYTLVRVLRLVAYGLVLILHFSNIAVISRKRRLHTACGWLLLSLSVSDMLLLSINLYIEGSPERVKMNIYLYCVFGLGYIASLFANLGISLDKFIAVQYSLRYQCIVTKRNLVKAIAVLWISSITLSVLLSVVANVTNEMLYFHVTHYVLRFACSILLLATANHIRNIRNMHQRFMEQQRRQRSNEKEGSPSHLQRIKSSVSDVIRLNVITAIVIIIVNATSAMFRYGILRHNMVLYEVMVAANGLYLVSNPIIYITVIKDLRSEYRQIFGCKMRGGEISLDRSATITEQFEL